VERLQAQPNALLGDQLGGRFVHQEAVLDAFHTGIDGRSDRSRREGVRDDVRAPIPGRFNRGAQFGPGEGGHIDRTEGRRHPTARRQLDLGGAQHELLAHPHADLVGAVRHHGAADLLHAGKHAADGPRQVGQLAEIPVPAGDGDHGAGRIDARALDDAIVDGALETEHRPAHVANGGEAAHQRVGRLVAGQEIVVADVTHRLDRRRPDQHRVPMIVDQAGHQRASAALDEARVRPAIERDGLCRNRLDPVAAYQDMRRSRQGGAFPIEDPDVLK
jgi:hypothetical protein